MAGQRLKIGVTPGGRNYVTQYHFGSGIRQTTVSDPDNHNFWTKSSGPAGIDKVHRTPGFAEDHDVNGPTTSYAGKRGAPRRCKHCGNEVQRMHGYADTGDVCFPCDQFIKVVRDAKARKTLAVIDGAVWVKGRPRWACGLPETLTLRFSDGRESRAEYSRFSEVPKHFRRYLPDNAEIVINPPKRIETKVRFMGVL